MISRPTALEIASAYAKRFSTSSGSGMHKSEKVSRDALYDFLFAENYDAWFCNLAKKWFRPRELKEWLMQLHTGEAVTSVTTDWSWEQRQALGQRYLQDLAADYLRWYEGLKGEQWAASYYEKQAEQLLRRVELDGYVFTDGELLLPTADVLDLEHEKGILQGLYKSANLGKSDDAFEFLRLAEEHFVAGRWSDTISNARKFLELTLQEGARALGLHKTPALSEAALGRPVEVRQYLEREGVIEQKEREALDKLYGLLSHTGAHPYMAEGDQARLLRQLAMTLGQFALLRLSSALKQP